MILASLLAVSSCMAYPALVETLARDYGEYRMAVGTSNVGLRAELFVSASGRSWTLLMVNPGIGVACIEAAGTNWWLEPGTDPV